MAADAWNWVDADYMQSGVNVYDKRAGYGNMQADPATGSAIVGAGLRCERGCGAEQRSRT